MTAGSHLKGIIHSSHSVQIIQLQKSLKEWLLFYMHICTFSKDSCNTQVNNLQTWGCSKTSWYNSKKKALSRCLTSGKRVRSGELPQFPLSTILIYGPMSSPSFATSQASSPNSRGMVSSVGSPSSTWTLKKKAETLSEQKQVSPLNRRLSDLPVSSTAKPPPVRGERDIKQNNRLR